MTGDGPLTWGYTVAAVSFAASLFLVPLLLRAVVVAVVRWRDRWLQRHIDAAMSNVRYLPTVPRQEGSR